MTLYLSEQEQQKQERDGWPENGSTKGIGVYSLSL